MATTNEILTAIQNSTIAHAISKSDHMVGASLQIVHVIGFVLLLAALVLISLRIAGAAFKQQLLPNIVNDSSRLVWVGFILVVISGVLMFVANPKQYYFNAAFQLKMVVFVIAIALQFTWFRKLARSENVNTSLARIGVATSLTAWFTVGMAGRAIGFI